METLFLFILLGLTTYYIISRGVTKITTTPPWMLWLVLMTPAISLTLWTLVYGEGRTMPTPLVLGLFIFSPVCYWLLVEAGRKDKSPQVGQVDPAATKTAPENPPTPAPLRPITKEEEIKLRECFPWGIYYLQSVEYFPQAMVCRGKLRTNPDRAYQTINQNIKNLFGDRFYIIFQETAQGSPVFTLAPNPYTQNSRSSQDSANSANSTTSHDSKKSSEPFSHPLLALTLFFCTLFTTTAIGAEFVGLSTKEIQNNPALLLQGLPYALPLLTILSIHELAHYFTTRHYQIPSTLPYFIPIPFFLGTLGAFIQRRSPPPHRKALFDLGIAGSVAGLIVTLPLLLWGLKHSRVVPLSDVSNLINFESLNPRFSLLLTLLAKFSLGEDFGVNTVISLHPVAIAAYVGLIFITFNLIPLGQLDGGQIVHGMFGQKTAGAIGQVTRLIILFIALIQRELLIWAILLFFIPTSDQPALNDVSELDNRRDFIGLVALGFLAMMIVPVPGVITRLLNI